tara:strand:+ start:1274 stop:1954 length:681 start_codon:yes stop_codon:yes gene_type:complete
MSDYTLAVTWSGKDALADSDAAKVISGSDFNSEFTTIQTAVNSKANIASPTLTGTPAAPTASVGTDTTQIATTAFVEAGLGTITAAVVNALVYPVGSIYFNMAVSTNPATLLGVGTWVAYATGEVLVGKESSGTFDSLNESLGAETASAATSGSHTLTTAEMPAHTHTTTTYSDGGANGSGVQTAGNVSGSITTSSTGGGGGHTHTTPAVSTLQPSVTVYIWKRTA